MVIGDIRVPQVVARYQRIGPQSRLRLMITPAADHVIEQETGRLVITFAAAALDHQDLLRSAAAGLGALVSRGDAGALQVLFDVGVGAQAIAREPIALVLGMLAMRHSAAVLAHLETRTDLAAAVLVLRDAFDMLDEDLEEERFFMTTRAAFWAAPERSPARAVAEELIRALEF